MDQRQWLYHPVTKGYFHCPAKAVDDWKAKGWQESEPPEEVNPAVAERLAWEREQAAQQGQNNPNPGRTARRNAQE